MYGKQIFLFSLLLARSCIAPLPGRHERASLPSTESVLQRIQRSLINTQEVLGSNRNPTQDQLSQTATELRSLIRNLHRIESEIDRSLYESTRAAIEAVINGVERSGSRSSTRRSAASLANQRCSRLPRRLDQDGVPRTRGGRRSDIDRSRLEAFRGMGFTVTYIANHGLLGGNVHRNTIHNFIRRNGISGPRRRYSVISDVDLREKITELNRRYPNSGAQEMLSLLRTDTPSFSGGSRPLLLMLKQQSDFRNNVAINFL